MNTTFTHKKISQYIILLVGSLLLFGCLGVVQAQAATTTITAASTTDPVTLTIAPGSAATTSNAFTLQTSAGTDIITNITIAHSNASSTSLIEVVSSDGATVYGSTTIASGTSTVITLDENTLTASTTETIYKIRITPKSHANLPSGNRGALIPVTTSVLSWDSTNGNTATGTDQAFPIIIDNQSLPSFGITGSSSYATKVDYTTGSSPRSVTAADLNNDGYVDLAVANRNSASVSVLINNGDGTYASRVDYTTGSLPYSSPPPT